MYNIPPSFLMHHVCSLLSQYTLHRGQLSLTSRRCKYTCTCTVHVYFVQKSVLKIVFENVKLKHVHKTIFNQQVVTFVGKNKGNQGIQRCRLRANTSV